jgi:hypothetical protein
MLELVGQVLAYAGVGLGILIVGFFVLDLLTPGNLGKLVIDGNPNAAVLTAATLLSLGLILWFAIFFTGGDWDGLDDTLVYGLVGVGAHARKARRRVHGRRSRSVHAFRAGHLGCVGAPVRHRAHRLRLAHLIHSA